ncbi:ExeM/NucH family extracellular endonuclease [Algicola sagamiensis]|uniref:ExeM/NucH family extracellular endonuclease n=1 Tax=Algicola sagamiensis TaxID=163869 RepID=UPI00037B42E1|nr:ExeM/NucH family extracellular endonuclease [Algicola sagamiensis]
MYRLCTLSKAIALSCGFFASTSASSQIFLSEYVEGSGQNKALELFNPTPDSIDLANYQIKIYYNGNTSPKTIIPLSGQLPSKSTYVLVHKHQDTSETLKSLAQKETHLGFNGDDAIVLVKGNSVVDSLGVVGEDPGKSWTEGRINTKDQTLRRRSIESGNTDLHDAISLEAEWTSSAKNDFSDLGKHLGSENVSTGNQGGQPTTPTIPVGSQVCGEEATLISAIQGEESNSPLNNQHVTIEAIVTADFKAGLKGYFVQEEQTDQDENAQTSEGLFVYDENNLADFSVGELVRIQGTVKEAFGKTQLTNISYASACDTGYSVTPATVTLPVSDISDWEAHEGMLVQFNQNLNVAQNYFLGVYGELILSSERLYKSTHVYRPGTEQEKALALKNSRSKIFLDDGSSKKNPEFVRYPTGGLTYQNTLRAGDKVTSLIGVVDYSFNQYRIQPTEEPNFVHSNIRPEKPELSGEGDMRVASFNVLNYFNGDGNGSGFPTARGAKKYSDFVRQRNKTINAIIGMEADIVGLMEIENDGFGTESAIQDLLNGLNNKAVAESLNIEYAYVKPNNAERIGSDAIAVGMIYNTRTVKELGQAVTISEAPFDGKNRQPLIQTFEYIASKEKMTIVVNHFKSKRCSSASGANADQGDGQGCWNPVRKAAAQYLAGNLGTGMTGVPTENVIVLGDLNAYAKEDPVVAFEDAGYINLPFQAHGYKNYSYIFDGESGSLDHLLGSASVAEKVISVVDWHINADEPAILDYSTRFKTQVQAETMYSVGPFRASDHDPVVVELKLSQSVKNPKGSQSEGNDTKDTQSDNDKSFHDDTSKNENSDHVSPNDKKNTQEGKKETQDLEGSFFYVFVILYHLIFS